ncbi:MAG: maleylpyruvate isomerase N-terminal domain-containing protein [Streptosporangiaceae bacterium]
MGLVDSRDWPAVSAEQMGIISAFLDGITVIGQLAAQFSPATWNAPTPCPEWRACDMAGHLRCVADDYDEYLDDAPGSRLARLMATGAHPETLLRKQSRQNAAELAALPDAPPSVHIAAFAQAARAYARRVVPVWDLPHHRYRESVVTVAGMVGAGCAEWHLHAWDLAKALGLSYRPAAPEVVLAGWRVGLPHAQVPGREAASVPAGAVRGPREAGDDPWRTLLLVSGRSPGWPG